MKPEISVVLPLYRMDKYINAAIESILNQTFKNFELIIICDDPSDNIRRILDKYAFADPRVNIYYQKRKGLVESLNIGIDYSKGKYIARMDADDISMPERLEKQYNYMERNPHVGVCGTNIKLIDENCNRIGSIFFPLNNREIKANLLFYSPFGHPSVIIKKELLDIIKYDPIYRYAEDYELWTRLSKITDFANLRDNLLLYRVHSSNVGEVYNFEQAKITNVIRKNQLISDLKLNFTDAEMLNFFALCNCDLRNNDLICLITIENCLSKIFSKNRELKVYPDKEFSYLILERFLYSCFLCHESFRYKWKLFFNSNLYKYFNLYFIKRCFFKFFRKNYLREFLPSR